MPEVDDLYGMALERFVPERTALARELRSAGRREEAAEVAALRKPSVAAWAVNQLVRTQGKAVEELFEAGDALRAAHDDVLAGQGDAESLRQAAARSRATVDALTKTARGLLTSQGHELGPTIIERVSDTLNAAALDDDAREQVRDGRLERELRHIGLGMSTGAAPRPSAKAKTPAAKAKTPSAKANTSSAKARAAERAAEREARRRLERATRAAGSARERRDKAAQALEEAEAQLQAAERAVRDLHANAARRAG